jgi:hypothetical protein
LCGYSYGAVIKKDWFLAEFGINPPASIEDVERNNVLYAHLMGKLRTSLLIDHNFALKSKPGYGQEVVKPSDQTQWAVDDFTSGLKKAYEKAADRLSNIDFNELTSRDKAEHADALAKLSFFAKRSKKILKW